MKTGRLLARGMRRLREQRGMTQAQLSEAVERHEQFISQLEREQRAAGVETIDALALALGVEPWELLRAGSDSAAPARRRDVLAGRIRTIVDEWPEPAHEQLLSILTELGRLAAIGGGSTRRRRKT